MWLCCNIKYINLVKSFELLEATSGTYLYLLVYRSKLQAYTFVYLFRFQASNMQIGYVIRQHATFASRENFECNY